HALGPPFRSPACTGLRRDPGRRPLRLTASQRSSRLATRTPESTVARGPRLSGLGLVFALPMTMKEGHPAYRSQSDNPLQGTTLGGRPDDPRREHTRDAAAGDAARSDGGREHCLPGSGDLADAVLSLAAQAHAVRGGRTAPSAPAGPARASTG